MIKCEIVLKNNYFDLSVSGSVTAFQASCQCQVTNIMKVSS